MKMMTRNILKNSKFENLKSKLFPVIDHWLLIIKKNPSYFIIPIIFLVTATITTPLVITYLQTPKPASIKTTGKNNVFAYEGKNQLYSFKIGDKTTNQPTVQFQTNSDSHIVFSLINEQTKINNPIKDGNKITYSNILENTDLIYETLSNGIKEEIILHAPTSTNTYVFSLDLIGTKATLITDKHFSPVFYDDSGEYLFHFEKPFAFDAAGARTEQVLIQLQKLKDGSYQARLVVDHDWLTSPDRTYPITIDPTIVHDSSSEFADGTFNRNADTGSGSLPSIETDYQELTADEYTLALWHMDEGTDNTCSGGQDVCDSSGNGLHGTFSGNAAFNGSGKIGDNASIYDGTGDFANVSEGGQFSTNTFTISAWAKRNTDMGTWEHIVDNRDAQDDGFYLRINNVDDAECAYNASYITSTHTISTGIWYHFVCVSDGSTLSLYINGEFHASTAISGSISESTNLRIGARNHTSDSAYFSGVIDEVWLSTVARTPNEIKLAASRRPSSVYTSEVIDLTSQVGDWLDFSWEEWGVATGDGETLYDNTNRVAQWNLNETSGTTADNAEGTSALDGTLSGFDSTASQDADPDSTWTANERRWGAGALKFDGTDSYVTMGDQSALDFTGDFSLGVWVKTTQVPAAANYPAIMGKAYLQGAVDGYGIFLNGDEGGIIQCQARNGATVSAVYGPMISDGQWHYIACTRNHTSDTTTLYVDGKLVDSDVTDLSAGYSSTSNFGLGARYSVSGGTWGYFFKGTLDAPHVFSRVLTPQEIMSNYNAGNIELQTRNGDDTSPDDGDWDAWSPTSGETAINDFDTADANLVSYWPFEDYATSTTLEDRIGGNDGTLTGPVSQYITYNNRGYNFSPGTNYITVSDHSSLDITGDFTLMGWVNRTGGTNGYIINKIGSAGSGGYALLHGSSGEVYCRTDNGTSYTDSYTNTGYVTTSTGWTHVAAVRSGSSCRVYINGVDQTTTANTHTTMTANAQPLKFGARADNNADPFYGYIDEFRVFNGALTSAQVKEYMGGSSSYDQLINSYDTTVKMEGDSSLKLSTGLLKADLHTVGLWRLDETGGSGAYLKDSSGNSNHLTPTGSSLTQGFAGKARSFPDSASDYLSVSSVMGLGTSNVTMEAWVNLDSTSESGAFIKIGTSNGYGIGVGASTFDDSGNNLIGLYEGWRWIDTNVNIGTGWHHVALTINSSGYPTMYLDGRLIYSDTIGTPTSPTTTTFIGGYTNGGFPRYVDALIDEVRISNIARNTNEIAEIYRAGASHYYTNNITPTNLSGKTALPFYIAADRPGSYLTASVGELTHDNLLHGAGIQGFWHLDEPAGGGNYIRDRSGNSSHLTPTGTNSVQGKFGKARNFNGTSDYLNVAVASSTPLDIDANPVTMEAWIKPDNIAPAANMAIVSRGTAGVSGYGINLNTTGKINLGAHGGGNFDGNLSLEAGKWYHVVGIINGSSSAIYINGQLDSTGTVNVIASTGDFYVGADYSGTGVYRFFDGIIDHVRISNVARTTAEVRASYEVGLRTHPITIDFAAALDSGNLIADSNDLSFTVDATAYGLSTKGSMLFVGDKIIIRENYDGTVYTTQGTVTAVTESTGAVTVTAWDTGSTFPSGGFTSGASVFKWQREYWPIGDNTLSSFMDGITHLKLTLLDGNEGRTIWLDDFRSNSGYLTTPGGSTITSATGSRYFQYRAILTSLDPAVSATISAVTLDTQTIPSTPSLDSPTDAATNQSLTPALLTTTTDAESDYLRYKIDLCENLAMTTNCQTFDQTSSQTGWSGQNTQTSTAYTSGTQATYTIQSGSPLDPATTYYWRSYAKDPAGTNDWSETQSTPFSFTTTSTPTAPTTPYAEGTSNPSGIVDLTPEFSAIHNDSDGDPAVFYQIQVNTASNFTGTVMWDSTKTAMASLSNGVRSTDVSYAGTALSYNGTTYYWRVKFWDNLGAEGAWSATQNFSTNQPPTTPTLDAPADTATNVSITPTLKTTATDVDSDYLRYKIDICDNLAMTTNCQTIDQTSSQTGWSGQNTQSSTAYTSGTQGSHTLQTPLSPNQTYYWRSYVADPGGSNTWSATQGTPYSFTTTITSAISCLIQEAPDDSYLNVVWTDVSSVEVGYDLQRSVNGGAFATYQTLAANTTSYQDTGVSIGNTYRYRVASYIAGPIYSDYCATSTVNLGNTDQDFEFKGLDMKGINIQ